MLQIADNNGWERAACGLSEISLPYAAHLAVAGHDLMRSPVPPVESAGVQRSALDELHFIDEDTDEFFCVAEVGDVGKSRLSFRTGETCLHGLHAVEVEFAEPIVRRLVTFDVVSYNIRTKATWTRLRGRG